MFTNNENKNCVKDNKSKLVDIKKVSDLSETDWRAALEQITVMSFEYSASGNTSAIDSVHAQWKQANVITERLHLRAFDSFAVRRLEAIDVDTVVDDAVAQ